MTKVPDAESQNERKYRETSFHLSMHKKLAERARQQKLFWRNHRKRIADSFDKITIYSNLENKWNKDPVIY